MDLALAVPKWTAPLGVCLFQGTSEYLWARITRQQAGQ